jgi:hypothetical protein
VIQGCSKKKTSSDGSKSERMCLQMRGRMRKQEEVSQRGDKLWSCFKSQSHRSRRKAVHRPAKTLSVTVQRLSPQFVCAAQGLPGRAIRYAGIAGAHQGSWRSSGRATYRVDCNHTHHANPSQLNLYASTLPAGSCGSNSSRSCVRTLISFPRRAIAFAFISLDIT